VTSLEQHAYQLLQRTVFFGLYFSRPANCNAARGLFYKRPGKFRIRSTRVGARTITMRERYSSVEKRLLARASPLLWSSVTRRGHTLCGNEHVDGRLSSHPARTRNDCEDPPGVDNGP